MSEKSSDAASTPLISRNASKSGFRVTVEFPIFLVMLGLSLSGIVLNNVVLYRTCMHSLGYDKDECRAFIESDRSPGTKHLEDEVQKHAMFVNTVKTVMESVVPAILSFFLGSWSDRHGRKPLITWPLFGVSLSMGMTVIYTMLEGLGPWWYLVTSIPFSLCGGFSVLFTGAFCYVSDVTTEENRSFRMTLLDAILAMAIIIGSVMSSVLLNILGTTNLLLFVTTLFGMAYAFSQIRIKETVQNATKGALSTVLDFALVREMFRECFKKRPNNGRSQILLLLFANSLTNLVNFGLMGLEYLYARNQLQWAMEDFTLYFGINTMLAFIGKFLGVGLVQKLLQMDDLGFAVVSLFSSMAEYFIKIIATTTWLMYFGATISLFKGISAPLIRSAVTKILPGHDVAKVFALMGAMDAICPLLSPLLYNSLYAATVTSFPMSVYVLSTVLIVLSIGMLMVVKFWMWKTGSPALTPLDKKE